jgi:hypothetical protein
MNSERKIPLVHEVLPNPTWKKVGERIPLFRPDGSNVEYTITSVNLATEEGRRLGVRVEHDFPVYRVAEQNTEIDATYDPTSGKESMIIFPVSDDLQLRHELIHSIELRYEPSPDLLALYENAKLVIDASSFSEADGEAFNFTKDVHEFIADGYNHAWFISALRTYPRSFFSLRTNKEMNASMTI